MSLDCIRCTEQLIEDDPSYDASEYTQELLGENIKHEPDDQVCITCANQYEHTKWIKNSTQPASNQSHEEIETQLQALREDESRLAD